MSVLVFGILLLVTAVNTGAAFKPTVSFSPNPAVLFAGENVTLTCNAQGKQEYYWYRDNRKIKTGQVFKILYASTTDSGKYYCGTNATSEKSDIVDVFVSEALVILPAPTYVIEGDTLFLRCRTHPGYAKARNTIFRNENTVVQSSATDPDLYIVQVSLNNTGTFSCSKEVYYDGDYKRVTFVVFSSIKELFSLPEIKVSPYPLSEEDNVTVTCVTSLNPSRADTELQFAFYRNGHIVQGYGSSNKYQIYSAQPEDFGDYTCEVQTATGSVTKKSHSFKIQVQGIKKHEERRDKPAVTFSPNWGKIFTGESVTLTCNVASSQQGNHRYAWYKNKEKIFGDQQNFTILSAEMADSGNYQCRTGTSSRSGVVRLDVSDDLLILQASPIVYEGSILSVRCHSRSGQDTDTIMLYKDDNMIMTSTSDTDLLVGKVNVNMSGTYKCTEHNSDTVYYYQSEETVIVVTELFSDPQIKANPYPIRDLNLTITCDAIIRLDGETTKLQFAFYRNGQEVQELSMSNTYHVQSAQMEDSGNYSCEVKTPSNSVKKMSSVIVIEIQELFSDPEVKVNQNPVIEGDDMIVTCNTSTNKLLGTTDLRYAFYRNGNTIRMFSRDNKHKIYSAKMEYVGNYSCEVKSISRQVKKISPELNIQVKEKLPRPKLILSPNPPIEGNQMTLSCETTVSQLGEGEKLQFRFVKKHWIKQAFSDSNIYRVRFAQLDDSGDYRCDVATSSFNIIKNSDSLNIQIQALFSYPRIEVSPYPVGEGSDMNITCNMPFSPLVETAELLFAFYRNGQNVQRFGSSNRYQVSPALLEDSGDYTCEVKPSKGSLMKASNVTNIRIRAAGRPVVSLSPNWSKTNMWAFVTITCNVVSATEEQYIWYKDNNRIRSYQKSLKLWAAKKDDSGSYQCQTSTSDRSDPVTLNVTKEPLILQAPPYVYEGDTLLLRCLSAPGNSVKNTIFYKDDNVLQSTGKVSDLTIEKVYLNGTGTYKCSKQVYSYPNYRTVADEVLISVKELFSYPKIKVHPYPMTEGKDMTLTCHTTLSPLRHKNDLQFAFYRNGQNVQRFSSSNKYSVRSALLKDSGDYTCEVKISPDNIQKMSNVTHIQIQENIENIAQTEKPKEDMPELFTYPEIEVSASEVREGAEIRVICDTSFSRFKETTELQFAFYRNGHIEQQFSPANELLVQSAELEDSGDYTCEVKTSTSNVTKMSNVKNIQVKVADGPVVSLSPNWSKTNMWVSVTLKCEVSFYAPGFEEIIWYKDNKKIYQSRQEFTLWAVKKEDTGSYQCQTSTRTSTSERSDAVTLIVTNEPLMLQAPPNVYEGDNLLLRCRSAPGHSGKNTTFYKDNNVLQSTGTESDLTIGKVYLNGTGTYKCTKQVYSYPHYRTVADEVFISVKELFSNPHIKVQQYPVTGGTEMTVICHTRLSSVREGTKLQFAFYRNGQNVQGFSPSNKYSIPLAQSKDSGDYTCEARTLTGDIKKMSKVTPIRI